MKKFTGPARMILLYHCKREYEKHNTRRGRPRRFTIEYILDRITYLLESGCPWRMLPVQSGSYKTIFAWFNLFSRKNVFENAFHDTEKWYRKVTRFHAPMYIVDTSFVKNQYGRDCLGKNPTDRSRKATKVSLLVDQKGSPIDLAFHPANKHDCKTLQHILQRGHHRHKLCWGSLLFADKGYDARHCRETAQQYGLVPHIPHRGRPVDRLDNRIRVVVEHTFGILDKYRRILMRFESRIRNFKAFHFVAVTLILSGRLQKLFVM